MARSEYLKEWRDKRYFGGQRKVVLERDGHKCVRCGTTKNINVHHKDFKGRYYKGKVNNSLDNLETLCVGCHMYRHSKYDKPEYMLKVAEHWDKSDRAIGRIMGVSWMLVARIRKTLAKKILTGGRPFSIDSRIPSYAEGKVEFQRK